jgi:A/G-specific adenine glycosylase
MISHQEYKKIQELLLLWFSEHGRDFPWRRSKNPYYVLIAEKLLQQTKARIQLVQAYHAIICRYPNPHALAGAKISDLQKIIKPLGLLYRASELIVMASEIIENFGGNIPENINDLLSLTGVGDYSARAVLSFAFNVDVPIVDTNVARFIHRVHGLEESVPANPARSKRLREYAASLLAQGESRIFNFAILDLCAAVCKPGNPLCVECPIQHVCEYGKTE